MTTRGKVKNTSQGGLTLWHGMTVRQLGRLAAYRPLLHWKCLFRMATLPGMGLYNSALALLERLMYGRLVEQVQFRQPPLFVIGHWRSGTTLLHNLIAQDPQFSYPNLYHCVFPNHFLVTERVVSRLTAWMLPESRPMDNLPCGWDVPQEEDIAMTILTCISPCMLTAHPDNNEQVKPFWDLSLLPEQERAEFEKTYLWLLKRLTLRDDRQLVLKSPVNTLRIPMLLRLFPGAKFVYIYRNPLDVFRSTVHMRKAMFRENSLGIPHLRDIEDAVLWVQEFTHRTYERDKQLLPPGALHELRFENLEQDPLGEMEQVYAKLGLDGWERLKEILAPQVPALRRYQKNEFHDSPEVMQRCYDRLRELFDHHGYEHPAKRAGRIAA